MSDKPTLNKAQLEAVSHGEGPLLIIAGAGTGKTTVITQRIAHLILDKGIRPDEVLALTFTEKAAQEMEERVDQALPYGYVDLWISTFHSFCEKIIRQHGLDIGLPTDFKLLTQTEQWLLVRQNLDKFKLDYYQPRGNPTKFIHALIGHFSRAKDEEISPKEYLEFAQKNLKKAKGEEEESEANRILEVAQAYEDYQQLLLNENYLDFGDLINYTLQLFKERPVILKRFRDQFRYVLVDEFQDTNYAQYELIKLIVGEQANVTVVGDDDQCLPGESLIEIPNDKIRIDRIVEGDEVLTAIGRGSVGVSKVNKVIKNKKTVRFLDIKTKSGYTLRVTDNHKMFAYIPNEKTGWFYVYLMHRKDIGYRLGTTNNLITRLRLERSGDSITAIAAFKTDAQARYHELFLSLKYGIPTSCFQERGTPVINNDNFKKLYEELDITSSIDMLAKELYKDLNFNHHTLENVYRGNKSRVNVNLKVCYRNYKAKHAKSLSRNYEALHELSFNTSDPKIVKLLKKNKYVLNKSKKRIQI